MKGKEILMIFLYLEEQFIILNFVCFLLRCYLRLVQPCLNMKPQSMTELIYWMFSETKGKGTYIL